ncbi:hypothetical protein LINPERHAP2_LOCUS41230 [Linum perenne]
MVVMVGLVGDCYSDVVYWKGLGAWRA